MVVQATPTVAAPSLGKTASDGRLSFTLREVQLPGKTIGETFAAETATGVWVLASVDVTNEDTTPRKLDVSTLKLTTADGRVHPASVVPSLPGWDTTYISGVAPKKTATALVAFDVPAGAQPASLTLEDTRYGKGVALPLR